MLPLPLVVMTRGGECSPARARLRPDLAIEAAGPVGGWNDSDDEGSKDDEPDPNSDMGEASVMRCLPSLREDGSGCWRAGIAIEGGIVRVSDLVLLGTIVEQGRDETAESQVQKKNELVAGCCYSCRRARRQ
jgi:hypothetical protein